MPEQPDVSVGCDNRQGGHAITEHLLRLGRRRIAFVGNASAHCPEYLDRYRGYCSALQEAGIEPDPELHVDAVDSTEHVGHVSTQQLLARGVDFDAVFAASDLLAIGAMHALSDAGRPVPEKVSVVGFDDIPMATFASPALTTVQQDTKLAGEVLVDTLLRLIRGESANSAMLSAQIVVRKSCGGS
jgi:DNA-binding LacI/PurR family transcriptional regulator